MTIDQASVRDRIVIVDDDEKRLESDWKPAIEQLVELPVQSCTPDDFKAGIIELEDRRARARSRETAQDTMTIFDQAAILVVDYDLFDLDRSLDGDAVAYLARCFSHCGLIVGVNQDRTERWYDLTLQDHPDVFTDVSVGSAHLCIPDLWITDPDRTPGDFRPWHWPHLTSATVDFEACVDHVSAHIGVDVLEVLGVTPDHRSLVARDVVAGIQVLADGAETPRIATVAELVDSSPLGQIGRRDVVPDEFQPRVAAARLRKWLETIVLPRQDILVDAPHLVSQIPGLLEDPGDLECWQRVCALVRSHGELPIKESSTLADAAYPNAGVPWTTRPLWWLPDVASSAALDDMRAYDGEVQAVVFCEDTSSFVERTSGHRISTRVGGNRSQRWVALPRDPEDRLFADYEPAIRLVD